MNPKPDWIKWTPPYDPRRVDGADVLQMMIIQAENDKAEQEEDLGLCEAMVGQIEADLAAGQPE